jgi:uncharacterized protein YyaL (SSP411 family)
MLKNKYTNNLINEKSPYLLQHAHNPVDWFPWGDEAFEKAKREDKPIFLSIGYSACHWCHVMERESFEDMEVAQLLNRNFISIKVDREERPDVDHLYMEACMVLNGQGGWPLSAFLTHNRHPFYAGTYFPKDSRNGMTGFVDLLEQLSEIWKKDRQKIEQAGYSLIEHMGKTPKQENADLPDNISDIAYGKLAASFDKTYGGFGGAPKFPSVHNLMFLLFYSQKNNNNSALDFVKKTLNGVAQGGIFDHIGGGFCRYSTDQKWLIPHFEKMLYDNAMLMMAYSHAAVAIDMDFAQITRRIADYCTREMLGESGGFFTAQDADSEGVEGKYYVWKPYEIKNVLGITDGTRYCELFDITNYGNFEGFSIPNLIGKELSQDEKNFAEKANKELLKYRNKRVPPFKDDKVLTSSNSLMIAALALSSRLFGEPSYLVQAEKTANFILQNLSFNLRLMSSWRDSYTAHLATSDDYAYFVWGLIELYQASLKPFWLKTALEYNAKMLELFWNKDGGFYLSGSDVSDLPLRQMNENDGALPSGNSVAALNMLKLSSITGDMELEEKSNLILKHLSEQVKSNPLGYTALLCSQLYQQLGGVNIVVVNGKELDKMIKPLYSLYPFVTYSVCGEGFEIIKGLIPHCAVLKAIDGKATAYLCQRGACQKPVTDCGELKEMINNML